MNDLIQDTKLLYVTLTLSVASIVFILSFQSVYSANQEINFLDVNTSAVSKFSVAAWFKTSTDYRSDAFIVNKPGADNNMNYGIWMTNVEKVQAGFETSNGKPMYATSPLSYSDGKWHYTVVTFDGSVINLYVDGIQVAKKSASGSPDGGGDQPVRMGANSEAFNDYFVGNVDEIRVWRVALTPQQVTEAYQGTFDIKYQVLYLDFSKPMINQTGINQTGINQTGTNQTGTNQTGINQTGINQTGINQTGINQTGINQTGIQATNGGKCSDCEFGQPTNETVTNQTGIQATNETGINETRTLSELIAKNETGNANKTNDNIQPLEKTQIINETGIINVTGIENQTSEPSLSNENNPPKAFDQSVSVDQNGQTDITLVADDKDKDSLQFDITADPVQGSLDNFDKEKGTVTYIPQKDYSGGDKFSFRVIDDKGADSNEANVDISVKKANGANETQAGVANSIEKMSNQTGTEEANVTSSVAGPNQPPKADAGDDQKVQVNTEVKLDGSKSSDEDGKIVSYKWEQTDGPKVDLKKSDKQIATFAVPESAADSKLVFKLTVVDDKGASNSDDLTVEVENVVQNTPPQNDTAASQQNQIVGQGHLNENVAPKADAGDDQKVQVNTEVKLDGSKSSDEDGKIVSYKWEQTDGPKVDLKKSDKQIAIFAVPESAADSKLAFKLTVADDKDASSTDDISVQVEKNSQPSSK